MKSEYRVFPAKEVVAVIRARTVETEGYISRDIQIDAIEAALDEGFRWVRTDSFDPERPLAIFERSLLKDAE